jgi:uncharacterized protein YecT (DUF1311 family)
MTRRRARWIALAAILAAGPAQAMDCGRAATEAEKAICASPSARAADDGMARAYVALRATLDAGQRAGLLASQGQWIARREQTCADAPAERLGICLETESEHRRAFLAGAAESGPGAAGRIVPSFRYRKGAKGRADLAFDLLTYPNPANAGERAFNAAVAHLFDDIADPEPGEPADEYFFDWRMRLTYASPQFVSAFAEGAYDTGGAHPNSSSVGINVNMVTNAPATFAELLDDKGAAAVFALCADQVARTKQERGGDPPDAEERAKLRKDVADATGDLKSWHFSAYAATVTYDPYAVASYAEGAFECVIPMATLRALAKPAFPLPHL